MSNFMERPISNNWNPFRPLPEPLIDYLVENTEEMFNFFEGKLYDE